MDFFMAITLNDTTLLVLLADDTLVIVTADHSHVFTIGGYPDRGNPIFGLTEGTALDRKKYTTLGYYNGPGAKINRTRDNPKDTESAEYKQQSLVPLGAETHGGEDVGKYTNVAVILVCCHLRSRNVGCDLEVKLPKTRIFVT